MGRRSRLKINLDNYEHNLNELKAFLKPNTDIMQIVKADAYGHGALEIAETALENNVKFLGVANAEEGTLLRYHGIAAPILILSPSLISEIPDIVRFNLIPSISDIDFARKFNKELTQDFPVHINVDTGMGRSGVQYREFLELLKAIERLPNILIQGIFSHYSASEDDHQYSEDQLKRFETIVSTLKKKPQYIHISNSAGIVNIENDFTNLVRVGLLSYGVYPCNNLRDKLNLKPVMIFESEISLIKTARPGDYIGYNRTFKAEKELKYAVVPVGYADGYDYLLSNKGIVAINDNECPVIGKVSMDMITVDISEVDDCEVGTKVVILGSSTYSASFEKASDMYSGSPYELLCQVGRRAPREYYRNGKLVHSSPLLLRNFFPKDFSDKKLREIIKASLNQKLGDGEVSDIIVHEIVQKLFRDKDRDIHYRKNFRHTITFKKQDECIFPGYYKVKTSLSFDKLLDNNSFIIACATDSSKLSRYFVKKNVEYRWLLDDKLPLSSDTFFVKKIMVNNINLNIRTKMISGCLEINCSSNSLNKLLGKEVTFLIETETYYPVNQHQMSVFINELTRGVYIKFEFNDVLDSVEPVLIFSGQNKFPDVENEATEIIVSTSIDEWVFPNSGVVFTY